MRYVVVYDILTSSEWRGWDVLPHFLGGVFAITFGILKLRSDRSISREGVFPIVIGAIFCLVSTIFMVSSSSQDAKCRDEARRGLVTVEGIVENFHPMPYGGHDQEHFTVGGEQFSYTDFDISECGFHQSASHGGPIRPGLHVRIGHRAGRILKIEVAADH
jgi:hypothetical protein